MIILTIIYVIAIKIDHFKCGGLAHLARARRWQRRGNRFDSDNLHHTHWSAMEQNQVLDALKKIKIKLASRYPLKKLGVFGSFARNTQSPQSDIDIVVELGNPKMFDLIGIKQEIEETLNKRVDIVRIRKNMNQYLKHRIEKEAIYV